MPERQPRSSLAGGSALAILLSVAPDRSFSLCSSLDPVSAILVVDSPLTTKFVADLKAVSPVPVHAVKNDPKHPSDIWIQDAIEIGVRIGPDGRQRTAALAGLRGAHDMGLTTGPLDSLVLEWLKGHDPEAEVITPGASQPKRRWIDWYGNLEVSPRTSKAPNGVVLTGRQRGLDIHEGVLKFLKDQSVHDSIHHVDVSWLVIGHVDEAVNFVPSGSGFKVLVNSPAKAKEVLGSIKRDQVVFEGTRSAKTAGELADALDNEEHQAISASVAACRAELVELLGITQEDFIELPALYRSREAVIPNMVNCLVAHGHLFITDPLFPAFRKSAEDSLVPHGLTLHWMDAWQPYHVRGGEVHCGTNAIRRINRGEWR